MEAGKDRVRLLCLGAAALGGECQEEFREWELRERIANYYHNDRHG